MSTNLPARFSPKMTVIKTVRVEIKAESAEDIPEEYCEPCTQAGIGIEVVKVLNNSFNERLKAIISGENDNFKPIDMGCPHKRLLDCGLPNIPIQVSVKTITVKASQSNHPFEVTCLAHLPESICDPIAIFRSATSIDDTKVVLTELESEGVNLVVVIRPNCERKGVLVNDIRSIYPKHNIIPILEWICVHNMMEYYNKEKILKWLGKHQYIPGEVTKLLKDSTKVIEDAGNCADNEDER